MGKFATLIKEGASEEQKIKIAHLGASTHHTHVWAHAEVHKDIKAMKRNERITRVVTGHDDKPQKVDITSTSSGKAVHDHATGEHIGMIHESTQVDEAVKFHHLGSVPHKEVRIHDEHREAAHKLADGKTASHPPGGHLLTSYKGDGDMGTSHFVHTKREGDVVHFHDSHTGRHVATVSHADLAEHNPNKSTKYIKF